MLKNKSSSSTATAKKKQVNWRPDEKTDQDAIWKRIYTIGADSTGATGNFAPVLTQEPGQTLRFAPVFFMAVLWFFKWTLQLYLLNLTKIKGAKFAGSVGHLMTKMLSASGGLHLPLDPAGGSAPRPSLYARAPHSPWCPPNHWPLPPPMSPTELCSGTSNRKSAPMIYTMHIINLMMFAKSGWRPLLMRLPQLWDESRIFLNDVAGN